MVLQALTTLVQLETWLVSVQMDTSTLFAVILHTVLLGSLPVTSSMDSMLVQQTLDSTVQVSQSPQRRATFDQLLIHGLQPLFIQD